MRRNHTLARAITAILSASAAHTALAANAISSASADTSMLREIIVTATRHSENVQKVPITIQAITGRTLKQLHVQTLSDYLKYIPNVTIASQGPGQDTIYMRGLSIGGLVEVASATNNLFPNVASYLDNEPTDLAGHALDVYAVDLSRIEVLEGPQGTLFGAGAEAGAIRYITNKPRLNTFEADFNGGYGSTEHGDPNSYVNGVLNIPLVANTLAARVVIYNDERGGYIDNLPATFSRSGSDGGIRFFNGGVVPTNSVTINNFLIARKNINPVTYKGIRAEVKWKINDKWDALLEQSYQDMKAQGIFYQMPFGVEDPVLNARGVQVGGQPLPPLSVNMFEPSFNDDRFENTALTVHGKVGPLSLVYAGSYLLRNVEQVQDYTSYARGPYAAYYECTGLSYSSAISSANARCYTPADVWHDTSKSTNFTQEIRLSTPTDWRLRGLLGLFYEKMKGYDVSNWHARSVPNCSPTGPTVNCFLPIAPPQGQTANDRSVRDATTEFFVDAQSVFTQKAVYGSASYDIIPKVLTITGGMRYFDMYDSLVGGSVGSSGCKQFVPTSYFGPCMTPFDLNLNQQNPHSQVLTGHLGLASLSWHITPNVMVYYTYSQGFRPGGIDLGSSAVLPDQNGIPRYITPKTYGSDLVTNNEVGLKSEWFDRRVRFNSTIYQEHWDNAQIQVLCQACGLGLVPVKLNGPFYRVRGVEIQLAARPLTGLTVQGSAAWNSSELTNSPRLIDNNPSSPDFGKPITTQYVNGVALPEPPLFGTPGSRLANSPPFQANMRVRYEHLVGEYLPFVQVGFQHQAHSLSGVGHVEQFNQPGWTTYDATIGVSRDNWTVSVVGVNLTDVNKSLSVTDFEFVKAELPIRPRTIMLTFSYHFSERR